MSVPIPSLNLKTLQTNLAEENAEEEKAEAEALLEAEFSDNILSADHLRELTGVSDLKDATYLELRINTEGQCMDDLGVHCPNLSSLRLDGSFIASARDLGNSLSRSLRCLWIGNCGLTDLDGIEFLVNLQELHCPGNQISDVEPLGMHENIEVLDLSNNKIDDIVAIDFLVDFCPDGTFAPLGMHLFLDFQEGMPRLRSLNLRKTPLSLLRHYKNVVCSRLSNLAELDGELVVASNKQKVEPSQELVVNQAAKRQANAEHDGKLSHMHSFSWAAHAIDLASQTTRSVMTSSLAPTASPLGSPIRSPCSSPTSYGHGSRTPSPGRGDLSSRSVSSSRSLSASLSNRNSYSGSPRSRSLLTSRPTTAASTTRLDSMPASCRPPLPPNALLSARSGLVSARGVTTARLTGDHAVHDVSDVMSHEDVRESASTLSASVMVGSLRPRKKSSGSARKKKNSTPTRSSSSRRENSKSDFCEESTKITKDVIDREESKEPKDVRKERKAKKKQKQMEKERLRKEQKLRLSQAASGDQRPEAGIRIRESSC